MNEQFRITINITSNTTDAFRTYTEVLHLMRSGLVIVHSTLADAMDTFNRYHRLAKFVVDDSSNKGDFGSIVLVDRILKVVVRADLF